jgi:hypothetical protein
MLLHFFSVKITVMSNFWAKVTVKKIFLDRQMYQDVKILQVLEADSVPHLQGAADDLMPCRPVYVPLSGWVSGWNASQSS